MYYYIIIVQKVWCKFCKYIYVCGLEVLEQLSLTLPSTMQTSISSVSSTFSLSSLQPVALSQPLASIPSNFFGMSARLTMC